jgi:hypothetical protein
MAYVGRQLGPARVARDPVNAPMIRHWADVIGDHNPVYADDAAARATGRTVAVAPATMLQVWTLPGYGPTVSGSRFDDVTVELYALLRSAGFEGVVATNCEQEYERELTHGERIRCVEVVDSISPEKRTSLGDGHFVTFAQTYLDERDAPVGRTSVRVFYFRSRRPGEPRP